MSVCLAMIVRNEEHWLRPCLASALALGIDRWVIADTGSTDGTRELVRETLGHLPGELVEIEWQGYGPARSEVLRRARGSADLILMLDADMTVHGELPDPDSVDSWLVTVRRPCGWRSGKLKDDVRLLKADLKLVPPGGQVRRLLMGKFKVSLEVTR
jgi:glycosyltransferase involved in cell wall biosynthesis